MCMTIIMPGCGNSREREFPKVGLLAVGLYHNWQVNLKFIALYAQIDGGNVESNREQLRIPDFCTFNPRFLEIRDWQSEDPGLEPAYKVPTFLDPRIWHYRLWLGFEIHKIWAHQLHLQYIQVKWQDNQNHNYFLNVLHEHIEIPESLARDCTIEEYFTCFFTVG